MKQHLQLKIYFNNVQLNPKNLNCYLKNNPQQLMLLKNEHQAYKEFSFFYFIKFFLQGNLDAKCIVCGKKLNQQQLRKNKQYCSIRCVANTQQNKRKHRETNLKKYGVTCVLQNPKIKKYCQQKNLQNFGVTNPFYSSQIQNDIKIKKQKRSDEQKLAQLNKRKETNIKKYGNACSMNGKDIRKRIINTYIEKYGVDHPLKNQNIVKKVVRNRLQKKFQKFVDKIKDYVIPLFDSKEYVGTQINKVYKWKCVRCGNQFESYIKTSTFDKKSGRIPRCLKCFPFVGGYSYSQQNMSNFIKSFYDGQIFCRSKKIIAPYELDVYVPQKKVAFEFDGLYWHQDILEKTPMIKKTELCLEKGIQLVHIFQDQWLYKQEMVKDRIKNILGVYDDRVFARKCKIKEIKPSVCKQFLDNNHIQGHDNSKVRLGLFYNEELISVMTFSKPRFNKNYEYQLVRFASKLGYQVVGGASKLLKYFQRNYNPKNIISYADRRYSNGKLYYALGFQFLQNSEPNYWWYKNHVKYTRYQCQKHKLKQLLGQNNFDQNLSENQNMYINGAGKIYDCGNMVFIKQYV